MNNLHIEIPSSQLSELATSGKASDQDLTYAKNIIDGWEDNLEQKEAIEGIVRYLVENNLLTKEKIYRSLNYAYSDEKIKENYNEHANHIYTIFLTKFPENELELLVNRILVSFESAADSAIKRYFKENMNKSIITFKTFTELIHKKEHENDSDYTLILEIIDMLKEEILSLELVDNENINEINEMLLFFEEKNNQSYLTNGVVKEMILKIPNPELCHEFDGPGSTYMGGMNINSPVLGITGSIAAISAMWALCDLVFSGGIISLIYFGLGGTSLGAIGWIFTNCRGPEVLLTLTAVAVVGVIASFNISTILAFGVNCIFFLWWLITLPFEAAWIGTVWTITTAIPVSLKFLYFGLINSVTGINTWITTNGPIIASWTKIIEANMASLISVIGNSIGFCWSNNIMPVLISVGSFIVHNIVAIAVVTGAGVAIIALSVSAYMVSQNFEQIGNTFYKIVENVGKNIQTGLKFINIPTWILAYSNNTNYKMGSSSIIELKLPTDDDIDKKEKIKKFIDERLLFRFKYHELIEAQIIPIDIIRKKKVKRKFFWVEEISNLELYYILIDYGQTVISGNSDYNEFGEKTVTQFLDSMKKEKGNFVLCRPQDVLSEYSDNPKVIASGSDSTGEFTYNDYMYEITDKTTPMDLFTPCPVPNTSGKWNVDKSLPLPQQVDGLFGDVVNVEKGKYYAKIIRTGGRTIKRKNVKIQKKRKSKKYIKKTKKYIRRRKNYTKSHK